MSNTGFSIQLESVSKRYDLQWIFRNINAGFDSQTTYAICGRNGSGKSTMLRMLSAMESPTTGRCVFQFDGQIIQPNMVYNYLSFSAPYMQLPDYLTVSELITFHSGFKMMSMTPEEVLIDIQLDLYANKPFDQLSSGQKQKVKLALALSNEDALVLLDEPGTNLDDHNYSWFAQKIEEVRSNKLICIATNEERDLELCAESFTLSLTK